MVSQGRPPRSKQAEERREKILEVLRDYPYGTNLRELMHRTGISSTSTLNYHINKLRQLGKIVELDYEKQANGIRLVNNKEQ